MQQTFCLMVLTAAGVVCTQLMSPNLTHATTVGISNPNAVKIASSALRHLQVNNSARIDNQSIEKHLLGFQPLLPVNTTGLKLEWQGVESRNFPGWVMTYEAKYVGIHNIDIIEWRAKSYSFGWGERVVERQRWNGTVIKYEYDNPQANRWDNKVVEYERGGVYYQVWGDNKTTFSELLLYLKGLSLQPGTQPNMILYQGNRSQDMQMAMSIMPFHVILPAIPSSYRVSYVEARYGTGLIQPPLSPAASTVDANQIQISFLDKAGEGVQITEAYHFSSHTLQNITAPYIVFKDKVGGQSVTVYQHPQMQGFVTYDVIWKSNRTGVRYWIEASEQSPSQWSTSIAKKLVKSMVTKINQY